jgi:hypothetical protein
MRRRRTRNPWVSLALFLVVCSMGYATWELRHELRWTQEVQTLDVEVRERVETIVVEEFEFDECFIDLRSRLSWRPSERRYRLDITLGESQECEGRAREICTRIAKRIEQETEVVATVVAFSPAGRELARCVL